MPNPPTGPAQAPSRSPKFYHETVVFEIEGVLYRISKGGLQTWSHSFLRDLFSLPQAPGEPREGESDDNPIRPPQVTISEFEGLLEVIYSNQLTEPVDLPKDQWVGVLRLARQWDMPKVANLAVERLDAVITSPIEKARLGRSHGVPKWMKEGYISLVSDVSAASFEEIQTLGSETASRILWAQNQTLQASLKQDLKEPLYCGSCLRLKSLWRALPSQTKGTKSTGSDPYKCTNCNTSAETSYDGAVAYLRPSTFYIEARGAVAEAKVAEIFKGDIEEAERRSALSKSVRSS